MNSRQAARRPIDGRAPGGPGEVAIVILGAMLRTKGYDAEERALEKKARELLEIFDLDKLAPIAAEFGPTVEEIATPLDAIPAGATSPAFFR